MSFIAQITADISNFDNNIKKAVDITNSSVSKMQAQFDRLGDSFVKIGTKASILSAGLVAIGTKAFLMAADIEDAIGATEQIFKENANSVNAWAGNLDTSFGIAKKEALEYSNLMGSMLINIGKLTEQEASKQSAKLIELAGDLTAMYGGSTQDAVRALTGALKGNNTMLDNYGMAVNESLIKTKALELGLVGVNEEMTLQAKQGATLALIWAQTGAAQGQAAREADGASGAMRALKTEITNLSTELGDVLLPVITPVITRLKEFVSEIRDLSPEAKKMITVVAGIASAVGPLLAGLGGLLKILPLIARGFTLITGPIGIAITSIAVISFALYELIKPLTKTNIVTKEVANSTKQLYQELGKEQIEVDKLFVAYKSVNVGTEEHKRIKEEILSKYGQFLKNQVDEEGNIINIDDAYKQLNNSLRDQISLKIKNQRLETISISNINAQAKAITELTSKVDQSDRVKFGVRLNEELRDFSNSAEKDLDKLFGKLATLTRDEFGIDLIKSNGLFDKNAFHSIRTLIDSMKEAEMQAQGVEIAFAGISDEVISPNAVTTVDVLNTSLENLTSKAKELYKVGNIELDLFKTDDLRSASELFRATSVEVDVLNKRLAGLQDGSIYVVNVKDEIVKTQYEVSKLNDILNTLGTSTLPLINPDLVKDAMGQFGVLKDGLKEITIDISGILTDLISGAFASIGDALVNGDSVIEALGVSLLGTLGGIMVELGQMVIVTGAAIEAVKVALMSLGGLGAIAAGVALITIGSMFSAGARKLGSSMGGGGCYSGSSSMQNTRVASPMTTG